MVKRKTVSMSRPRGTVRRHQGKSGPSRENTHPTRHKPRFLGHFPSLANYFAFAFTSDRTGRTISRPEHRDVITLKPTASLNARPGTKLSQQPPSHTHPGTNSPTRERRLILPKMHKQGEVCTARRAHELAGRVFNRTSRAHPTSTGNKPEPAAPSAGHGVTLAWLTIRIGYDDADRLISYPDAHNLSR